MQHVVVVALYILKVLPIYVTCFISDYFLKSNILLSMKIERVDLAKAICDNAGHAAIAGLCWLIILDYNVRIRSLIEVGICGVIGSLVDVDHFIHARSLYLKVSSII